MKMYHFKCNSYDSEWTVLAENPKEALEKLVRFFERMAEDERQRNDSYCHYGKKLGEWSNVTLERLPDEYTIETYSGDQVLQTEVC